MSDKDFKNPAPLPDNDYEKDIGILFERESKRFRDFHAPSDATVWVSYDKIGLPEVWIDEVNDNAGLPVDYRVMTANGEVDGIVLSMLASLKLDDIWKKKDLFNDPLRNTGNLVSKGNAYTQAQEKLAELNHALPWLRDNLAALDTLEFDTLS